MGDIYLPESEIPRRFDDGIPLKSIRSEHLTEGLIIASHINSSLLGITSDVSNIDPDDAQAAGASGRFADAAHQHRFTTVAPSALTKTSSNTEGSSGDFVRADHGHSTSALPWGLLAAPGSRTTNTASTSGTGELDVAVDVAATTTSGRYITLVFNCVRATGTVQQDIFSLRLKESGTQVASVQSQVHEVTAHLDGFHFSHTYIPTAGSRTFEAFLVRISGTGTALIEASATSPCTLSVFDSGVP
jgi:hypothetical protein